MKNKQSDSGHIGRRVLAILVAMTLVLSMYLSYRAQIRFSALNYVGQVSEYAAQVTAGNTGYLSQDMLDRAWTILKTTIRHPRTYEDYDMYASIAIAREDYGGAAEYLQGCIDTYPEDNEDSAEELAALHLRQASLYVLTEEYDEAIGRLDKTLELDPSLSSAYFLRAQLYSMNGETEKAIADLTSYKNLDDSDPVILASLGQMYESTGDYENAIDCYTVGITDQKAYDVQYYADRARCRMLMEDTAEARKDLEEYFSLEGEDPDGEAAAMLAMCLMEDGEYADAIEMFHRSVEDGYETPYLLYSQSMLCAYMNGDYAASAEDGEIAITGTEAAEEDSSQLHFYTGLAYMAQEEYALAEDHLTAAAETDGTLEDISYYLGICALKQEEYARAEECFTAAAETDETLEDISYYLGICALGQEDAEAAIECFTASIEKDEDVTSSLYNRAVCYLQQGELESAETDLNAVLERNDDPELTALAQEVLETL